MLISEKDTDKLYDIVSGLIYSSNDILDIAEEMELLISDDKLYKASVIFETDIKQEIKKLCESYDNIYQWFKTHGYDVGDGR